jgi:hypothetical protein
MTVQRWETVYNELQRQAEKLGYAPPSQVGAENSQVFEFRVNRKSVLLVAFRDLGRKKDYSAPDRLWAEGLDLVLQRYDELSRQGVDPLPQAIAIVIDNIGESYVVITMDELIKLYKRRMVMPGYEGSRIFTFVVQRTAEGYFLQMPADEPPLPLTHVNSIDSIVLLLKSMKPGRGQVPKR